MKKIALLGVLAVAACGPTVKTVSVEPGQAMMSTKGASLVLHAVAKDEKGAPVPDVQMAWASSNAASASVDGAGKVAALKSGTADITASAGEIKGVAHIKVQIPGSLSILPAQATLTGAGQTSQLHLVVKDDTGNVVAGMPAIWSSSNPNVAAVDNSGNVHSMGVGTATISAHSGALMGMAHITVALPQFDKLAIDPKGPLKLKAGETKQLIAQATAGGKPVAGVTATWTVSDAKTAAVSPSGVLQAVKKGNATITATAGDKKADLKVTVK
jgi:alpha-amylase